MKNMKGQIAAEVKKVVKELTGIEIELSLEHPKDERHGDYSSNIAMALFQKSEIRNPKSETNSKSQIRKYKTPLDLAKEIVNILNTLYLIPNTFSRVEAVAPGFINFCLSEEYLLNDVKLVLGEKDRYGASEKDKNKKIIVEFTDPNPFKEFHIGHLYSNVVGETLSRLLESQGANVWRVCYQGDVGLHVAKTLYGIKNHELRIMNYETKSLAEKVKLLGQAYAFGVKAYEENEEAKREIAELNKKIYDKEKAVTALYEKGRQWSLEYFDSIYKRLGTEFKRFYFESESGKTGLEIVKKNIGKVFEESDGAVVFPGEKYGLHTRVFINSLGLPTYEAKDLGLAPTKYKDFPYDLSIIITAHEQSGYFKVVIKALSLIEPELARKTKHLAHGVVRLPTGKMSSRTGKVITGEWLLDEAKRKIKSSFKEMDDQVEEQVAIGAVKYALLKSGIGRDIAFDFNESISLEGNSGPYLQYTFARTQSVLAKLKTQNSKLKTLTQNSKLEPEEVSLLRSIHRFPEVVGEAVENFAPNLLCNYLFDLAQKFNFFYQKHQIIESESKEFRLVLTQAVGQIIKNGLYLLGIQAPERM